MKKRKRKAARSLRRLQRRVGRVRQGICRLLERPRPYEAGILIRKEGAARGGERLALFAHYDRDNRVDDYVIYYLKSLRESGAEILFISSAEGMGEEELERVAPYCREMIVRRNIGYDFGSWKCGLDLCRGELENYGTLLLCNDSVYAPLFGWEKLFEAMEGREECDFWGITDNYHKSWHLQSYFLAFSREVAESRVFREFWSDFVVYRCKKSIIEAYEIGLSRRLSSAGFQGCSYCRSEVLIPGSTANVTHKGWRELIEKCGAPVLKVELLRDNPTGVEIGEWEEVVETFGSYDTGMIRRHLQRMKG